MNSQSRKIVILHYAAPPVVGGVESVLGHHARLMADEGHHVKIVAGRGAQTDERIPFIHLPLADSRNPEVLSVKAELDAGRIPDHFEDLTTRLTDELLVVTRGVDYVIAHNVCSLAKNLPLTAALKVLSERSDTPKIILWHHDLAWTTPRYRAELHDGYPWDLLRSDWPGATQVVVSRLRQRELANLLDVPLERVNIVPNGVDASRFLKLETQTQTYIKRLNLLAAEPLLLLPVRITPRKNIELAIRTLAALRESYSRAVLVVTGPLGPHNPANVKYFEKLVALRAELGLGDAVYFLAELSEEYLPDAIIADLYRLADALLMPSREEGFGIPILEAGLSGLPIFCTDIPPLRELGGDQATYFLPDDNPGEVAGLIVDRLGGEMTFDMRVRVRTGYTWEQVYTEDILPLIRD
jgi:glycosyltransferase involved in cell wall biosynthesis